MNDFEIGEQPCKDYNPTIEYGGDAMWNNVHQCYGFSQHREKNEPYGKSYPCNGLVSFCETCYRDHHEDGYDMCGKIEERE